MPQIPVYRQQRSAQVIKLPGAPQRDTAGLVGRAMQEGAREVGGAERDAARAVGQSAQGYARATQEAADAEVSSRSRQTDATTANRETENRGLMRLGQSVDTVIRDAMERERQDQELEARKKAAEAEVATAKKLEGIEGNVGEGGEGYTDAAVKAHKEVADEYLKGARSSYQRKLLEQAFGEQSRRLELHGIKYEASARREKRAADAEKLIDANIVRMLKSPELTSQIFAETATAIENSALDAKTKRKMGERAQERLTMASVTDLAEKNPAGAIRVLGEEKVMLAIGPEKAVQMRERLIRHLEAQAKAERVEIGQEIGRLEKVAGDGYQLPPDQMERLEKRVRGSGSRELAERWNDTRATLNAVQVLQQRRPDELEQVVTGERQRLAQSGATPGELKRLEIGEKLLSEMRTTLEREPVAWAARVGKLKPQPIDWATDDAGELAAQVAARIAQARVVSAEHGNDMKAFFVSERELLASAVRAGGDVALSKVAAIVKAAGEDAGKVMAEIAPHAPEAAMIGKMINDGASKAAVDDAAKGLALRRDKAFEPRVVEKDAKAALDGALGNVLAKTPNVIDPALKTANAIYETRARRNSWTTFQPDEYRKIVHEVMGGIEHGGLKYGGVGTVGGGYLFGGRKVLVPAQMRSDAIDDALKAITDDDLKAAPPRNEFGKPVPAAQMRKGALVSVGVGRYLIAQGDPDGDEPKYLLTEDRKPYVLDLNRMVPALRQRRPDLFLGGGR